jgi:hypothetical protein
VSIRSIAAFRREVPVIVNRRALLTYLAALANIRIEHMANAREAKRLSKPSDIQADVRHARIASRMLTAAKQLHTSRGQA